MLVLESQVFPGSDGQGALRRTLFVRFRFIQDLDRVNDSTTQLSSHHVVQLARDRGNYMQPELRLASPALSPISK